MNFSTFFEKSKYHIYVVIAAAILAIAFFTPALFDGKELYQNDIVQFTGGYEYQKQFQEKTGETAFWTPSLFSGMPTYQNGIDHPYNLGQHINSIIRTIFPSQSGIVFISIIGGYLLGLAFGLPWFLAAIGAIGFAFSSWNLISIEAGHNAKIVALAWAPAVLAGFMHLFNGKRWLGICILAITLTVQISANHFQISYYLLIVLGFAWISFLVSALRNSKLSGFLTNTALAILVAVIALLPNLSRLITTYEYQKESIRGGKSELTSSESNSSSGLDRSYAMRWSYGIEESLTFLIPNYAGSSSSEDVSDSPVMKKSGIPKQYLKQIPAYWGTQPFTSGPEYFGILILALAISGFIYSKNQHKWWILASTVLAFLLSLGENFFLADIFFDYVPMYNKFRTPSMWHSVMEFTLPLMAALFVFELIQKEVTQSTIQKIAYVFGGLALIIIAKAYIFTPDFIGAEDARLEEGGFPMKSIYALRKEMLQADALRSLGFLVAGMAIIFCLAKKIFTTQVAALVLLALIIVDTFGVAKRYLPDDKFNKKSVEDYLVASPIDREIQAKNTMNARVLNLTVSPFNDATTSFNHASIGGYHGAKILRYQELIERQISNNNQAVLDMLNTRWIIQNGQSGPQYFENTNACGKAWLVDTVKWVENADAEMDALTNFKPKTTVVIDKRFETAIGANFKPSGNGTITQTSFSPNSISYDVQCDSGDCFAVFSEVYYKGKDDWQAKIDGTPVDHARVNYVLRGMKIPQGKHTVTFDYVAHTYTSSNTYSLVGCFVFFGLIGFSAFQMRRKPKAESETH